MPCTVCLYDGCWRAARGPRGFCEKHGKEKAMPRKGPRVYREPCSIEGCPKMAHARGWCNTHYNRWKRAGDPMVAQRRGSRPSHAVPTRNVPYRSYSVRVPYGELPTQPLVSFVRDNWGMLDLAAERAFYRIQNESAAPMHIIDRISCALAVHPSAIYGELWWDQEAMKEEAVA